MPYLQENASLASLHTFGFDVHARWLLSIQSLQEAVEFLADNRGAQRPLLILGGGSNVLFQADYPGVVLRNEIPGIECLGQEGNEVLVAAGAGVSWHGLVMHCLDQGWFGLENLSLIPGTVGAAPIQNIGAYGIEIKDSFEYLESLHLDTLQVRRFSNKDCAFGYRDSYFKRKGAGKYLITKVVFRLSLQPDVNLSYAALKEALAHVPGPVSPRQVSEAVIAIRQSKLPDPAIIGNAGSFFKNPEVAMAHFQTIRQTYPDIPSFPVDEQQVKIPAAWLIQTCGWKGFRRGQIGVHDKQALVLVNHGGGSGAQLVALSGEIMESVFTRFGIQLEREVRIV